MQSQRQSVNIDSNPTAGSASAAAATTAEAVAAVDLNERYLELSNRYSTISSAFTLAQSRARRNTEKLLNYRNILDQSINTAVQEYIQCYQSAIIEQQRRTVAAATAAAVNTAIPALSRGNSAIELQQQQQQLQSQLYNSTAFYYNQSQQNTNQQHPPPPQPQRAHSITATSTDSTPIHSPVSAPILDYSQIQRIQSQPLIQQHQHQQSPIITAAATTVPISSPRTASVFVPLAQYNHRNSYTHIHSPVVINSPKSANINTTAATSIRSISSFNLNNSSSTSSSTSNSSTNSNSNPSIASIVPSILTNNNTVNVTPEQQLFIAQSNFKSIAAFIAPLLLLTTEYRRYESGISSTNLINPFIELERNSPSAPITPVIQSIPNLNIQQQTALAIIINKSLNQIGLQQSNNTNITLDSALSALFYLQSQLSAADNKLLTVNQHISLAVQSSQQSNQQLIDKLKQSNTVLESKLQLVYNQLNRLNHYYTESTTIAKQLQSALQHQQQRTAYYKNLILVCNIPFNSAGEVPMEFIQKISQINNNSNSNNNITTIDIDSPTISISSNHWWGLLNWVQLLIASLLVLSTRWRRLIYWISRRSVLSVLALNRAIKHLLAL